MLDHDRIFGRDLRRAGRIEARKLARGDHDRRRPGTGADRARADAHQGVVARNHEVDVGAKQVDLPARHHDDARLGAGGVLHHAGDQRQDARCAADLAAGAKRQDRAVAIAHAQDRARTRRDADRCGHGQRRPRSRRGGAGVRQDQVGAGRLEDRAGGGRGDALFGAQRVLAPDLLEAAVPDAGALGRAGAELRRERHAKDIARGE